MIIDAFPFFNELDCLEIRLNELAPIVDKFVIVECKETYGGKTKPLYLGDNWQRFAPFHSKIVHGITERLEPKLKHTLQVYEPHVPGNVIRTEGRLREANAREQILPFIYRLNPRGSDIVSFGDCDEVPRAAAIVENEDAILTQGIHRLKQRTYYYNVNTQIDYGRDICSRARVGCFDDIEKAGGLFPFRNWRGGRTPTCPAIEDGGWHFSYFGGDIRKLHEKVDALNPFLSEYKLFGDTELAKDIVGRRDLHRRPVGFSELPQVFEQRPSDDPSLPAYLLANPEKFKHFTADYFKEKYGVR